MRTEKSGKILANFAILAILATAAWLTLLDSGCRSKSVSDYLAEGDKALHDNQLATAEQDFTAAAKTAPDDARTHLALGNLYSQEHNYDVAIGEYKEALRLDSRNARSHSGLARVYGIRSQLGPAEEQYRAAIALDSANVPARLGLAWVLRRVGRTDEAEREIRTAVGLEPQNGEAHFALASLLADQHGRETEADTEFAQAHSLDPRLTRPGSSGSSAVAESASAPSAPPAKAPGEATAKEEAPAPGGTEAAAKPEAVPHADTTVVASASPPAKMKLVDKNFRLFHNSPVYQDADSGSAVVGQVHKRKFVHVIGMSGDWLQIKLRNGTVGFIPTNAAE